MPRGRLRMALAVPSTGAAAMPLAARAMLRESFRMARVLLLALASMTRTGR